MINYNTLFFKQIDTELKAYLLGYIVADGCITIENRKDRPITSKIRRVQFQCAISDLQIIELIKSVIAPNNKISYIKGKGNKQDYIKLRLANTEIVNDLITLYDIQPRKTYHKEFQFPNIPKEIKKHFTE